MMHHIILNVKRNEYQCNICDHTAEKFILVWYSFRLRHKRFVLHINMINQPMTNWSSNEMPIQGEYSKRDKH